MTGTLNKDLWPNNNTASTDGYYIVRSYDPGYAYFKDGITRIETDSNLAYGFVNDGLTIKDAHYLQGNYYSWDAATAGIGASIVNAGARANTSVCPKGWRVSSRDDLAGIVGNGSTASNADARLLIDPFYFIRGGLVRDDSLTQVGINGYLWSSNVASNIYFA